MGLVLWAVVLAGCRGGSSMSVGLVAGLPSLVGGGVAIVFWFWFVVGVGLGPAWACVGRSLSARARCRSSRVCRFRRRVVCFLCRGCAGGASPRPVWCSGWSVCPGLSGVSCVFSGPAFVSLVLFSWSVSLRFGPASWGWCVGWFAGVSVGPGVPSSGLPACLRPSVLSFSILSVACAFGRGVFCGVSLGGVGGLGAPSVARFLCSSRSVLMCLFFGCCRCLGVRVVFCLAAAGVVFVSQVSDRWGLAPAELTRRGCFGCGLTRWACLVWVPSGPGRPSPGVASSVSTECLAVCPVCLPVELIFTSQCILTSINIVGNRKNARPYSVDC